MGSVDDLYVDQTTHVRFTAANLNPEHQYAVELSTSHDGFGFPISSLTECAQTVTIQEHYEDAQWTYNTTFRACRISEGVLTGTLKLDGNSIATATTSVVVATAAKPLIGPPTGFRTGEVSETSIKVRWDNKLGAVGYKLEMQIEGDTVWTEVVRDHDTNEYEVQNLTCGATYYFRISARGDGTSYLTSYGPTSTGSTLNGGQDNANATTSACHPEFGQEEYRVSVREDAAVGSAVATVEATSTPIFSIVEGNTGDIFTINSSSGAITLAQSLDYELQDRYALSVLAESTQDSSVFDIASVVVTIIDVNESVRFGLDSYQFAIPSSARDVSSTDPWLVGAVRAYDLDLNDDLSYSISSGNSDNVFEIDPIGRIWADRALLPAQPTNYSLTVAATDSAQNSATTTVIVKYTDASIISMTVSPDRFEAGRSIDVVLDYDGNSSVELQFTIEAVGSGNSLRGGRNPVPPTPYTFRLSPSEDPQTVNISWTRISSVLDSGPGILALSTVNQTNPDAVIQNGRVVIHVFGKEIAVGQTIVSEWGVVSVNPNFGEPNERRILIDIPPADHQKRFKFELNSTDRDTVLILWDYSGSIIEWNDNGGPLLGSKIIRNLHTNLYYISYYTKYGGGKGRYTLGVSITDEPLTDPDDEFVYEEDIPLRTPQSAVVIPTHGVNGLTWKDENCRTEITSAVPPGKIVCLEATGDNFAEGDSLSAVVYTDDESQPWPVPIAGIFLKPTGTSTAVGTWVTQWIEEYEDSAGEVEYGVRMLGGDSATSSGIVVRRPISSDPDEPAGGFAGILSGLGIDTGEIQDILDSLWLLFGEGYDSIGEFTTEAGKGALFGEWGVRNDPNRYGVAYYLGWMVAGFLPGVDVPGDVRDAFALEVTKCSVWDLKCLGSGVISDAIDVVAVVPGLGTFADIAQVGKIIALFNKSDASDIIKQRFSQTDEMWRRYIKDPESGCWGAGFFARGNCLQNQLYIQLRESDPKMVDLDNVETLKGTKPKMEAVDFYTSIERGHLVVSVKSLDLNADRYQSLSTLRSTLNKYLNDLENYDNARLVEMLRRKQVEIDNNAVLIVAWIW